MVPLQLAVHWLDPLACRRVPQARVARTQGAGEIGKLCSTALPAFRVLMLWLGVVTIEAEETNMTVTVERGIMTALDRIGGIHGIATLARGG